MTTIASAAYPGLVLDVSGTDNKSVILYQDTGADNQKWSANPVAGGSVVITSIRFPSLGLEPIPSAPNAPVVVSSSPAQWKIISVGGNRFIISLQNLQNEALVLTATSGTPETQLRVLPDNGTPSQKWTFK